MVQQAATNTIRGGLDLISPPLVTPPGRATAAMNYEPEARGVRRLAGFERFDGRLSPADADPAFRDSLRAAIQAVPGVGPTRGVFGVDGSLFAIRDAVAGGAKMHRATLGGWVEMTFGSVLDFTNGTIEFIEAENLIGLTSGATARIRRYAFRSGAYNNGDATGYLVLSDILGTFQVGETITGSTSTGTAKMAVLAPVSIPAGGKYDVIVRNFYGVTQDFRAYAANGVGMAFEFDGEVLAPIKTGADKGPLDNPVHILGRNGDRIICRNGDPVVIRGQFDKPQHIGEFKNHLWLSFASGSLVNSGIGEPLDYRAIAGAGEIAFGERVNAMLPSVSGSFVLFGQSRTAYLAGNDTTDFVLNQLSDRAGALEWSASMFADQPIYMDAAGLRKMGTTAAFGNWKLGTLTTLIDPLIEAKRNGDVLPVAALAVRAKDQYRLFYADGTGFTTYLGAKEPETFPFKLPFVPFSSCAVALEDGAPERYFIGAADGFVYEIEKGNSFDGAAVEAYIRLGWNSLNSPSQDKRFHKATMEIDAPSAMTIGVSFQVDYGISNNLGGTLGNFTVAAGSPIFVTVDDFADIDWITPAQGLLEAYLDGLGRNVAVTLYSLHTEEAPHLLSSMTLNFSPRGLKR